MSYILNVFLHFGHLCFGILSKIELYIRRIPTGVNIIHPTPTVMLEKSNPKKNTLKADKQPTFSLVV
jgi:hypothetical protein